MKVLLAVGAPHSSHRAVLNALGRFGLAAANPSRYEAQTPEAFHALMLSSHEVDISRPGALQSLKPGKLWSEMAVDLFMANINQPLWGWADHQSALAMDFWADFDPQVRFVVCYDTPHAYVADVLADVSRPDLDSVENALGEWTRWNSFLLGNVQRLRDRCLLVNSQEALRNPSRLLQMIGLEWQWTLGDGASAEPEAVPTILADFLARGFIPADHVAWALADKLDSQADLRSAEQVPPTAQLQAAWTDWVAIRELISTRAADKAHLETLTAMNVEATEAQNALKAELEQLRATAQSAELDQVSQLISRLTTRIESGSLENIRAAELVMENEHLMVALHQAQKEVEELLHGVADTPAGAADVQAAEDFDADEPELEPIAPIEPVDAVTLDMRQEIDGENWYGAEADGRWAGPGLQSSITMPPVVPGPYVAEIYLADAMAPDIVYGLRLEAFGVDVPFELSAAVTREAFPIACVATIEAPPEAAEGEWSLEFTFPRTVSPAENGSSDTRQLAMRVMGVQLKRPDEL